MLTRVQAGGVDIGASCWEVLAQDLCIAVAAEARTRIRTGAMLDPTEPNLFESTCSVDDLEPVGVLGDDGVLIG